MDVTCGYDGRIYCAQPQNQAPVQTENRSGISRTHGNELKVVHGTRTVPDRYELRSCLWYTNETEYDIYPSDQSSLPTNRQPVHYFSGSHVKWQFKRLQSTLSRWKVRGSIRENIFQGIRLRIRAYSIGEPYGSMYADYLVLYYCYVHTNLSNRTGKIGASTDPPTHANPSSYTYCALCSSRQSGK